MPIRPNAARETAQRIVDALVAKDERSAVMVNLVASQIVLAVERDELLARAHAAETKLVLTDRPQ